MLEQINRVTTVSVICVFVVAQIKELKLYLKYIHDVKPI